VCLLLLALLVWLDRSTIRHVWHRRPKSGEKAKAYDFEKYHGKTFTAIKVVDGDTIDIDVPDGSDNYTRIRLLGIDAPETRSGKSGAIYVGAEAADFAKEQALGEQVTVYLDKGNRTRGYYGRLLAYVQLPDRRFLNEVLVAEGFAYADLRFRHSFSHKYEQLEASARRQKKGLWEKVTRDQLPEWLQRKKPNLLLDK
jgi:endonuclease YncB( thermonuclease family)